MNVSSSEITHKTVAFRVDATVTIGLGHLSRCLNLANALRKLKLKIFFIVYDNSKNSLNLILQNNFEYYQLVFNKKYSKFEDARKTKHILEDNRTDLLIVDHYELDKVWEEVVQKSVKKLVVIDDLANREHVCNVLIDHNFFKDSHLRYKDLLPASCKTLLGPSYALLKDIYKDKAEMREHDVRYAKNILICFGGSDPTNQTEKAINACINLSDDTLTFSVILGSLNANKEILIKQYRHKKNIIFYCDVNDLSQLMSKSDLAIGGGGVMTLERCCMGLPSLVIAIARNQEACSEDLSNFGAIEYLGPASEIGVLQLTEFIQKIITSAEKLAKMSYLSQQLVDGKGVSRVSQYLMNVMVEDDVNVSTYVI